MPVYKYNGTTYDIPEDVVSDFEKDMPEATLAYQVDGTVYDIPVSEKKGFLDTYPNASLYGEEVAQPAPSAREQLQAFYKENGAFLDDFEKRDTADRKLSAAESMDGGFSFFGANKNNSLVTDEERKQYGVLDAQRKQLEKAWYTSDEYLSQKNATALELGQMRNDIHNSKKAYVESQPQIKMSGLENAVMEGKTIGDYESQQFDIAARIMDKTIKLHNAPSKYDSNSGLKNMGIGAADKATDPALLSAGLTEITDNVGARVVLQKVQKELGNLNDLSEEKIEKILSPAEKAVLRSWARYAQEQLNRQGDLSLGYQAGQGAVESLAFMAEFALTGGVGKAASEGAETLAKWLGKKWYTGVKGLGDEAAEAVMKAAGEKTLGKYGQKLGLALAETAGRTFVTPSTYRNISEKATEIETDEEGNSYLVGLNDAFIKGYADSFIENLSEGGRVNALGDLVGDIAGNIPAWKKMVNAFSNTKASELLKRLNSTGIMNTLRAGGWHGFGEEYLEEWYGNALRTITGVDKNALKDFATLDNQMVTLASFLPISIFGGTVSTGQVISAKRDLDKKAEALQSALMGRGYDKAQAKNMIDMMRAETPQGISNLITPLIRRVAGANENEARELAKPAMEFAWAVQRYQSYDTKYSYQQQEQRDNLKAEMETKLGKFWMEDENGQQTVQRGVNEKGEVVYLLGKKDIEETAEGIGAEKEVAAIDAEGNHIFVFPSDYRLEEELPMNDFLGIEIMTQKRDSEAVRMASERDAKFAEVKSRSRLGTQLNIGTNEAPVVATISKVDADGVVVETPEGFRKITYTELANKYADINPAVYTDAELDEQEADNISAERAQREAALDQEYENDDDAIEELAEAENEIEQSVEESTKLPLKDDGTVDQAALWNESPARWAKWNDEQKQDGGADTLAYLNTAIKAQTAKIEQLVAAQEAETDFDRRDAIAAELSEARMRQGDLLALHEQYTAQVEAQAIQQQAAQPVQPAPQLTEEEKAALEEERRKPLRAKAKELSEKLGVKVKIAEDLSDVKESKAREQLLKSVVSNGKQKVAGWYNQATGEVTIYLPHAESVEDVEKTFIHEVVAHKGLRGLLGEEGFNVLCDAVWDMMSEGDKIRFINYPGVNGDKRAAADEYMAHFAETLNLEEAKPDMWERIVAIIKQILDSMGVRLRINQEGLSSVIAASYQKLVADAKAAQGVSAEAVTETATETIAEEPQAGGAEVISEEQLSAPNSGEAQQIIASDGEVLADTDGKGGVRFSIRTWEEGGRDYLAAWLANDQVLAEDEKADILARMDEFYKNALLYSDTYAPFGTWSDAEVRYDNEGNPLMSVVKANGDYAMNLDFSLVCKKRRPLNRLLRTLINRNAFGSYDLKEREIAEINWILQEHGFEVACALCFVDSKRYRVAGVADVFAKLWNNLVTSLAPKGVQIAHFNYNGNPNVEPVENGLDTLPDEQLNWKKLDKAIANFKKGSVEYKVAQYLREHPEARKLVDATDFIEAEGFEAVKEANPDLLKFYNMKKGTGGPKASFGDVQYLNDILKSGKKFDAEKAYAVGGVRLQSFSDFVPHMYFDYMQLFAELAAKKLPVHAYTKETLFAKIFGLTGAKINLSLVPAVVEGGVAPGLDAEGNYAWADPVVDAEGNVIQQGQTFPYGEAMAIQRAEGYSKNCGAIAVGISDAHIEKMLDDPNIPFIIPYHKSSLNAIVARMTNIDQYKDYTNVQNTRKASGSKLDKSIKDFNFNEYLHGLGESGTPQMAAQAYLDWCRENKFIPKFSQFAYHPNYYKLLQDFNTIDLTTGEYAPQGAVTMTFPSEQNAFGNVETLIQQGLQEDAALEEKMEQEIDGIADQVVARLEEIAKEPKMSKKQQAKKMAELADERMANIKEQSGVIDLVEEAKKAVAREEAKDNVSFRITPEMKEIKEKTQADGTFMKAPNSQPTNLSEEQWLMVRTENFKKWFGDWENDPENASKVVDENGEPKVVFHQTNQNIYVNRETGEIWDELGWKDKMEWDERDDWEDYWEEQDFNTFSRVNARTTNEFDGFFFAPEYDEYHEYGDRTIAAFVNIKNPASREDYNIDSRYNDAGRNERIRLQEAGFDGVIRMDGDNVDEYIAFEPNQIKSATDNNGDFNPKNNDIRFRVLDTAKAELKEKPIKLNGMYRFNLKNAFKGVKDNGGSYPYIKVQLEEVPEDYSGEKITYNGMLEGFAVVRVPKGLITEGEKDNEFFIDPKAIENELWDVLRATENYYEFKHGSAPYQRDWLNAEGVRFRIANENQAIFVSNAAKAVEGIKMEKATPEQWLKMIEKNGGLKAGEDKWMGLSDFLKSSDKKTLTKAEVLDFVNEHMIQIEEQHYGNREKAFDDKYPNWRKAFSIQKSSEEIFTSVWNIPTAVSLYNQYHEDKLEIDQYGSIDAEGYEKLKEFADEIAVEYFGTDEVRQIQNTRLTYTTDGLGNKHEIALTVPTIESWKEEDEIHFGDAGDGRAVAWIRFGDTWKYAETTEQGTKFLAYVNQLKEKYGIEEEVEITQFGNINLPDDLLMAISNEELYEFKRLEQASMSATDKTEQRILVIDEIQSKRHQEGREKGYRQSADEFIEKQGLEFRETNDSYELYWKKDGRLRASTLKGVEGMSENADMAKQFMLHSFMTYRSQPAIAPFEKNWHELAMKRMLRYAAENGYDAIAWTKGDQQAERYNLGKIYNEIEREDNPNIEGRTFSFSGGNYDKVTVNEDGVVVDSTIEEAKGKPLSDLVGKDLAVKMMSLENYDTIDSEELRIGGEGMKGFYDRMLPAFMNKYGKKWGVKVEDIELPNLEEAGRVMHSVPVTEEMKASVMEGQVMFRISESKGANESIPNYEFESDLRFRLSKNNRELIGKWLNKRGDLTEQAKEETLDLLDQFDDATLQLSMGKWFAQNAIRLPDDVEKCMQAVASAKKAKVDPMKFAAPMEIIDQYGVTKPKDKPINPDKVSTLSKVRELPNGLTIYDVEESEESRKNMREIINTHFGKESSPWCLLQGNDKGELTQKSAEYWKKYNAYPKQVVFKDGKLLAFCANDTEERRWWDRMDKSYAGIPVNEKLPNDRLGRSRVVEYNEETGKQAKVNDIKKFVTKDGMRSEWTWRTPKENDIKEYRKVKTDTEEMVEGFDKSSWNIPSFLQKMLPKESVRFVRSAGVEMTFDAWGKILNYWDENTSIVYDGNETAIYTNDERYLYRNGKLVDVIDANNITYTGAETQRFSAKAKEHLTQAKDIQKNAKSIAKQMVADLQGESLRFRVRGENESAMDFTKKEVENFTKRFYDVAPIYVVDKFSSKAELAKALEMDEQYITDEQYQAILDGYNGNGKAFYSADWSLIITFAKSDNSDDIEHNLFHESVHKVDIEDIPDGGKLGQWFWNNADSIQDASTIKDAIENAPEYSEEDYAREMLAELLAWYMSIGETEILINQLPSEYQKTVKSILSEIRYDSREEDNLRQQPETTYSRAKDAIRKGTKEYGGKRENAKSNELSAEERRIIGEYFPEFNKSEDVRMRVNSQGKELTEGQREFFANSKAVDKDGNLLVLYHGTPRAGFTEFKSGWFTTSKEDAISYSGDRKGRLFDPNEEYVPETLTAGDYRLGYMTFDSEEDRAEFLERFPYADEVMSERDYENARMEAEDEEYDALTARRKEFAEVWNAYREYERERFVDTTIGDLIANPEAYTEEDLMRAMLEYDSNAPYDNLDDMSVEERKDALVSALQNANEETDGGVLDMVVPTRVPRNGEGLKHNDLGNRTYEVYANVENPYEIDANGRGSEFESGDVYEAVEKALADEQYDGVIIRNWRVGRTQQLGDVVVPKNGSQIKLTSNENPTESSDIRFRTSLELDNEFGDAWRNQQNEDGRHSTQVANTKSTYEKIGHYLEDAGMKGASILDASSGLGLGTQALREMGFQVDDVEPFPSENREAPTFSSYADIDGKYDVVISNAVLNVIPDDWRADVLHQMADAVKEGGKMIINTRPASNIAQQGVEGKTRITLDSPSEILVKRGDRIAAYQKGFTSEELAEWIKSELGEGWRVEKATKKNSGISGEGTAVVIKDGDNVSFRTTGTPTDEVVANGVDLTPSQTSEVAANIFAALPEESRKKITDGLNGNILGLKDAILQIPANLASKENWNDEDRAMADIVAEEMTKMVGEMTRPFSAPEALWLLYNNLNKSTDLVSLAQRSLVQRNLGFDAQTLATENEAKESLRFRQVGDARINATASLYNKGAVNAMTRLKESFVDMNASVEELVKAIEERTGKKAEGFENILWALNQQSSRGLAAMEDYERRFLNPMYDAIRNIMDKGGFKYEDVVRYVILKHGLERNKKLAQRDAKAHYQEIYDEIIEKINSMDDRQKRTYLTNAQLKEADAKAKLAALQAKDTSTLTEDEMKDHKKELAVARKEVKEAEEYRERAEKIRNMSEQEAKDELNEIFEKIENGTDSIYKELRESDYSGLTSMFYDQLGVDRNLFATEEAYQSALMDAKEDKYSSLEEVEAAAEAEVKKFEGAVDTKELWKRVNAATKETLRQQYEANMISKDQYESLRDMFEYYVPLRGFKDNTAEDMYTYYRKPNSTGYTKPILGAEGRKTEAESPFGWIASMAGSAIASNVKNEAKLALFYFVSNRQDNGVATISKTWYVDSGEVDERGKKIFKPAYPPFSEDLSSAEGKAQYEIWQANMKELQKKGQAYEAGQRLNLGNAVVNISDANKPEHIVAVKVGGKEYTIVINGNPRAAQAINGELNLEGTADDYSALFGPVLRWMSSVNTSYNPEFWITNMMRDMAFTWMAVNTKGADDKEYRKKFGKNWLKAWKVVSLVAKNEKGTLGNSPIEQAYKDFVENGGVTGYTQIKDNETWEKEIEEYLKSNDPESLKSGKMMRGMKTVFHAAHRFGESLEQVSRFAAFLTAQEMGKSINEAINDAKEITVNFNRKGSGKMISLEEAKHLTNKNGRPIGKLKQWWWVGFSSIAPLGRRFIMFFNAAIQGLNATYKLWKANPKRFGGWVMGYFAVGAMNAILHAMMDDDDDYLDMPQYERRNALMIGGNGAYLKWALPQEARAFYALGDIVVESMLGRNPQKFWRKGGEAGQILTTIGEVLPINPTEGWRAIAPSIAIPALELMINEDYKGEAIYNDSKWLSKEEASRTANWNTAKSGTGWVHVKIAQGLNFLTGGDKYDAGLINIRPEAIEHLVQSAFGGTIRTADKFIATISAAIDPEEDVTVSQTPFLNRVLTLNDQRYRNVHVNEVFDYYAAEAEHAKTLEKKYRKDGDSDALLDLTSSDEYKWMMIYENYKKPLENVRERLKVAEGTRERKQIMREQDELKKMMIKQISNL